MAMMRFTRLLNKSGLRMVSVVKKAIIGLLVVVIVFFIGRIYESQRGPALHRWHTWTANEMTASEIDHATFAEYQTREAAIFRDMKSKITDTLSDDEKTAINRFYAQSLVYPDKFHPDWNRSFILLPQGKPRGAAPRPDGFALQRALSGAALSAAGICRRRAAAARTWDRPRRAHRGGSRRVDSDNPACGARSDAAGGG